MSNLTRRRILCGGAAAAALAGTARHSALADDKAATWASLTPGFTVLITQYIIGKGLAQKHGVALAKPTEYAAVSTYYNDFAAGNFDICVGSWDVFAARRQAGVPIKLLCTITTADMIFILSGNKDVNDPTQLKGKTLAAVQSTGTYRIVSALIKDAIREEWAANNPDAVPKARKVFADCLAGLLADTRDAVATAGQNSGFPPEVLAAAITSKRLRFLFASMTEPAERHAVTKASEFLVRYGLLQKPVGDDFFVMR